MVSEPTTAAGVGNAGGGGVGGERVLWESRAAVASVALRPLGLLVGLVVAVIVTDRLSAMLAAPPVAQWGLRIGAVLLAAALLWQLLVWINQRYVLTDRRLVWESGVLRRLTVEAPLDRVQNAAVAASIRERIFGLGTVAFATAGTDGYEVVWSMVARPAAVLEKAREAIRDARQSRTKTASQTASPSRPPPTARPVPPVIGLAGGIGAGKSEAAAALRRLGCLVLDSDAQAKGMLDVPEVRDTLVSWWGEGVLSSDANGDSPRRIDRRAVAAIVFERPEERKRLEGLIHPRLKAARWETIERARRETPELPAIVIDAPLLFEAGVDAECDAVVFIDAPPGVRLERVKSTRGWDEAELKRREAAQMPVEEKRRRASHVVENTGTPGDLERRLKSVLEEIQRGPR